MDWLTEKAWQEERNKKALNLFAHPERRRGVYNTFSSLGLTTHTRGVLIRAGFDPKEVAETEDCWLLACRNLGRITLSEIRSKLPYRATISRTICECCNGTGWIVKTLPFGEGVRNGARQCPI